MEYCKIHTLMPILLTMKRKKILVVDDDPAIVDVLTLMLEDEGYVVEATTSGRNVQAMQDNYPDLLLLDIRLSGMDGRDICRYLKNHQSTENIPIILISASRDIERSAIMAGADDFLAKPFEMNDLLAKIQKYTQLN